MSLEVLIVLIVWTLIVVAVVLGLLWLLRWIAAETGMPANLHTILRVIIIVIAALIVLSWVIGFLPGPPGWRTNNLSQMQHLQETVIRS